MGMLGIWKSALTNPKKTFASEKKKGSLMAGAKNLAVPGVVLGLVVGLVAFLFSALFSLIPGLSILAAFGAAAIIILPVVFAIGLIVMNLIGAGINHLIATLLGGKGKYEQFFYISSIFTAPILLITMLVVIVPLLGWIAALLLEIYSLYLMVLALKEVHSLSTGRAVAVVAIGIVLSFVLGFGSALIR